MAISAFISANYMRSQLFNKDIAGWQESYYVYCQCVLRDFMQNS